jgi:hypothetical protein
MERKKAGLKVDVPPAWFRWANNTMMVKLPAEHIIVQCIASEVNGRKIEDNNKKPTWLAPCILAIPRSAQDLFVTDITSRADNDQELSLSNNLFGDFCGWQNGSVLLLRKVAGDEGSNNSYNIRKLQEYPLTPDYARKIWQPWDDVLWLPKVEDTIEWCIETFDAKAVDYALRETNYADYIPEEHRGCSSDIAEAENVKELKARLAAGGYSSQGHPPFPTGDAPKQGPAPEPPTAVSPTPPAPAAPAPAPAPAVTQVEAAPPPPPASGIEDGEFSIVEPSEGVEDVNRFQQTLSQVRGGKS